MDSTAQPLFELDVPFHPGEYVVEYLEAHQWSQSDLARRSGLTPKTISEICSGKASISPTTALAFEKVFSRPAHLWLGLQRRFDEYRARERAREEAKGWTDWSSRFPLAEMRKYPWFGLTSNDDSTDSLLRFFGVSSPEGWRSVWDSYAVTFRQTRKPKTSLEAIAAWVRATELEAAKIDTASFSDRKLMAILDDLRALTRLRVESATPQAQELCASVGVALVWIPELVQTGLSGCARMLSDNKALIGLSFRYKTDDQMWFTFFHELGHLLLHRKSSAFILDNPNESLADKIVDPSMQKREEEANRFAADSLIPPELFHEFIEQSVFTNDSIHGFAERVGVGPGIVVGRLQHEGLLKYHQGNKLKQEIHWQLKPMH